MNTVHPKLVHTKPQTLQRRSVIAEKAGCSQSAGSKHCSALFEEPTM